MKKILGLDLGTTSIGWALVNEAENFSEKSSIIKVGVRVNPLSADEISDFEKGKSITTNADRRLKRGARRNLQRYKLRREKLISTLKENGFINENTILTETKNSSTFQTYRLRAKAATEEITLEEFARVLLMLNKKRGYKSSRKTKNQDEGSLIDGMDIAKYLYSNHLTPGQYLYKHINKRESNTPEFYRSDLIEEFERIWEKQSSFYPETLTSQFKTIIQGKGKQITTKIFKEKYNIYTADNKGKDKKNTALEWRVSALEDKLPIEQVAYVIAELNGAINNSSGYLGAISDRSKELYFNKQTIGQYFVSELDKNPHFSIKNKVFYRNDYLDEFNTIWDTQAQFHKELSPKLKHEIRDIIIYFQRPLKSQKGLISFCEFESQKITKKIDGKDKTITIGCRVCPKSSPLFQEFKIWQILNSIKLKEGKESRFLSLEEKHIINKEASVKGKLSEKEVLALINKNSGGNSLNYRTIEGNRTQAALFDAYQEIISISGHGEYDFSSMKSEKIYEILLDIFPTLGIHTDILKFDYNSTDNKKIELEPLYSLWHILYSYEGDQSSTGNESLIKILENKYGFKKEYAQILLKVSFQDDYGNLSAKAIKKILPYLIQGNEYSQSCELAGYRHSKSSLTKEELDNKLLVNQIDILPKNSLRNPVVEKILNQLINVVNSIIAEYGRPDEIRIELTRDLKKNAQQREEQTKIVNQTKSEHERIKNILQKDENFGFSHVSRNDIIRYKLYEELKDNGYKTLYSNTYIPIEKLFSKQFDIEHIIPQSRIYDDSFSNKTLELRDINLEKGNDTAFDFMVKKYSSERVREYEERVKELFYTKNRSKYTKLLKKGDELEDGFINRDISDTGYIAKKAKEILETVVRRVISTTGSITKKLREDWQLVEVMKELNWDKYDKLGLTSYRKNEDGKIIKQINDWTKRNDHRHHAMDALTIAFTTEAIIQYFNTAHAKDEINSENEAEDIIRYKRKFKAPIENFRAEAKKHLEQTLISIKAKNKVVTQNINKSKSNKGVNKKIQLTPRGKLHLETIYGERYRYNTMEEKVGSSFTLEYITNHVAQKKVREALLRRLEEFDGDPKKAFTGKNSLEKNPIYFDDNHKEMLPSKVKVVEYEKIYTIRKDITPEIKLDKVIDKGIRKILEQRLNEYNNDAKKAFSNLDENPIFLNKEKGITIKKVTISGISNATPIHEKRDQFGQFITQEDGSRIPTDYVNTGNNHHVAIYRDGEGKIHEQVVSFYEATTRAQLGYAIIDKDYKAKEGWEFLFSMKQNEYFVFPNEETGFNPHEVDLLDPSNYADISPNLYRVQKFSNKDYVFRHHLETMIEDKRELSGVTWKRIKSINKLEGVIKVRVNHLGQIVSIGEY